MAFASPVEAELISGLYYDKLANPYYLSPDKLESDYSPVRFARELKLFRRWCRGGRVLDVGCSTGAFLFQLKQQFPGDYDVLGIGVAGPALDHAERQGVPVLRQPFLSAELPGPKFPAVTFWAVLEHLANPREFLRKAAEVLEPGGHCFILVPNFRSLATRLLGAKYRYIFPQHVNYFTRATLHRLAATEPGFRPVYSGSSHFNPIVIWQDSRGRKEAVSDQDRAALLKKTTAYKQNPVLMPLRLLYGWAEQALGFLGLADNLVVVLRKRG
jgi:SAM-dependent methyltransferase